MVVTVLWRGVHRLWLAKHVSIRPSTLTPSTLELNKTTRVPRSNNIHYYANRAKSRVSTHYDSSVACRRPLAQCAPNSWRWDLVVAEYFGLIFTRRGRGGFLVNGHKGYGVSVGVSMCGAEKAGSSSRRFTAETLNRQRVQGNSTRPVAEGLQRAACTGVDSCIHSHIYASMYCTSVHEARRGPCTRCLSRVLQRGSSS